MKKIIFILCFIIGHKKVWDSDLHKYTTAWICSRCKKQFGFYYELEKIKLNHEINPCECGVVPKVNVHNYFFYDKYSITCPATKIFRSRKKAVKDWNKS